VTLPFLRAPSLRLLALVVVVLALASATTAEVVYAHAEPERSNPAADTRIPRAPDRLDVWFTQELFRREGANALVVTAPDGTRVDDGETVIDPADREHMSVGLQPDLPPGDYTVRWTTLSAIDGDAAEGTFSFTIDPTAPEPTPAATQTETAALTLDERATSTSDARSSGDTSVLGNESASFPWWAIIAAGAIVASTGLGAWALLGAEPGEGT